MGLITEDTYLMLNRYGFPRHLIEKYQAADTSIFDKLECDHPSFLSAKKKCRAYISQLETLPKGCGFVLIGKSGSGKSLLASAMIFELIKERQVSVRMVTVDDVIVSVNQKWVRPEDSININRPSVLVIDNFPKTMHQSRDTADLIHQVTRQRFNQGKRTIITAQVSKDQLTKVFSAPFVSFLRESAIMCADLCDALDYRVKIQPELNLDDF